MQPAQMFMPFGSSHLITLGLLAIAATLIIRAGRRWSQARLAWLGRALAACLLSYAVATYAEKATRGGLSWESALPLELCDWVLIACVVSLFWPNQLASEIAYFWGFAGTLQATLTPDIIKGFPSYEFVQYFWGHGGILLAIFFITARRRFRPRPGSVVRMILAANVYLLIVGSLDAAFGWNYGFLCEKPVRPSLLDLLGPWPWYLISAEGIAALSFFLLELPWKVTSRAAPSEGHPHV